MTEPPTKKLKPLSSLFVKKFKWTNMHKDVLSGHSILSYKSHSKQLPSVSQNPKQLNPQEELSVAFIKEIKTIKIAGFDIDGTLIETKTSSPFPSSAKDWKWKYPHIPTILTALHNDNYHVCFFSNQKGANNGKGTRKIWFMQKLQMLATECEFEVYAALEDGVHRKPDIGMWKLCKDGKEKEGYEVDVGKSFYVGDAAGRRGDHSDCDKGFARNVGLVFHTPEEYFGVKSETVIQVKTVIE